MKVLHYVKQNYLLLSILLLAAFLRLYHLDYQSIWLDEIHTMIEANPDMSLKDFDSVIMMREGIPHLYFLSVRLFFEIFGYSTFAARLFSAVVGILSVYAIYLLGREIFNRRAGLIAAMLLAVNYFHIYYSQEARSYAMLLLFTVLAFYRLHIYIRKPTRKNAIYFGLLSGLITHAHPIGLTVIVAQFLILLFVLIKTRPDDRKQFFTNTFISGIAMLVVFAPVYRIVSKVSDITSFWVTPPGPESLTQIIREFLGYSELTFFIFSLLFAYYAVRLFSQKLHDRSLDALKNNKMVLGFLILSAWISLAFMIPLLRSYLQVPMIINRYFINILPAILIILAISAATIRVRIVRSIVLISLLLLSLVDLFVVRDYYNKTTKTQYREVSDVILKSRDSDQVVSSYGWLMSFFFKEDEGRTVEMPLGAYVEAMRSKTIPMNSFWYMDGTSRPYTVTPEQEQFLNEHFTLSRSIERNDAWAKHYRAKVSVDTPNAGAGILDLKTFKPYNPDANGNLMLFENGLVRSPLIKLEKGNYNIVISGNSLPEQPLNGENAHLKVKVNSAEVSDFYLSENKTTPEKVIPFTCTEDKKVRISLIFDNDKAENNIDRNGAIYSVRIDKR